MTTALRTMPSKGRTLRLCAFGYTFVCIVEHRDRVWSGKGDAFSLVGEKRERKNASLVIESKDFFGASRLPLICGLCAAETVAIPTGHVGRSCK